MDLPEIPGAGVLPGAASPSRPNRADTAPRRGADMPIARSARVHPTAVIDPEADLGEEVQVGPYVVIEGPVRVGAGCVLRPGAHLCGLLTMGEHNQVHSYAVLGDYPQHLKYGGEPTRLEIGDHNIF